MSSREKILSAVKRNQPDLLPLPDIGQFAGIAYPDLLQQFTEVLQMIGGNVISVSNLQDISAYINEHFNPQHNLVTTIPGIDGLTLVSKDVHPHNLETVELAVMQAAFGVAENGAVWLSQKEMQVRVLPFICQHLAVVLTADQLLANMHDAYTRIGDQSYDFAAFIAGPSKTADIEQSLVLGAHGPVTMTIFLLAV